MLKMLLAVSMFGVVRDRYLLVLRFVLVSRSSVVM